MHRLEIPRSSSIYPDDVSPPESIRTNGGTARNGRSSPDVSPITDPSSAPAEGGLGQGRFDSHIPISKKPQVFGGPGSLFSRKTRPPALASGGRSSPSSNVTRWDDFSGERTAGEKGKPASTSPDAVRRDVELKFGRRKDSLGNSVEISGPTRRVSSKTPWVPTGWKGPGGRHAVVNPMLDKPLPPGKSPNFPAGSHQRSASNDYDTKKDLSRPAPRSQASPSAQVRAPPIISESIESPDVSVQQKYDSQPLPETTAIRTSQQPTPPAESPPSGLSPNDTRSPLARNPSTEQMKDRRASTPLDSHFASNRGTYSAASPELTPGSNLQDLNKHNEPQSRFSTTTYATTAYDSPPATPETQHDVPMPSPAPSILDRKRPVQPAGLLGSKVAARKPTPSQISMMQKTESDDKRRLSKSLPKEPTEEKSVSRVESLQAKLDALRRRRTNLQTVIHELTNVVQPSSAAYDMASRQEIKKTVDGLNKELAEVVMQEHDTGLNLHRAWKRHDDATAYEPTHLWVRRVTS